MHLPKALWRYALTFLRLGVPEILALARVSTGWRRWVLSRGMVARCVVDVQRLAEPHQDAVLSWLSGVLELNVLANYSGSVRFSHAAWAHLGGLRSLRVNLKACPPERLSECLAHLTSLRKLHLSDMDFGGRCTSSLPAATFGSMPMLHELGVSSTGLLSDATLANVTGLTKLCITAHEGLGITDAGFQHLRLLKILSIRSEKRGITDAAFSNLDCLEELDMSGNSTNLTGAAFKHLTRLHTLDMDSCRQHSICDASFRHLTRLTKLDMSDCWQPTITDAALSRLGNLVELNIGGEYADGGDGGVTGSGFKHLTSLRHLTCLKLCSWDMLAPVAGLQSLTFSQDWSPHRWSMPPPSLHSLLKLSLPDEDSTLELTDAMLQRLTCLTSLRLEGGGQLSDAAFRGCGKLLELDLGTADTWSEKCTISDSAFAHLTSLTRMRLQICSEAAFRHLSALQALDCSWNCSVTDAWISQLPCLRELSMAGCSQEDISDAGFRHLSRLEVLHMNFCSQPTITDAAFADLPSLHELMMSGCSQPTITDAAFAHLPSLSNLVMVNCMQDTITPAVAGHLRHVARVACSGCSAGVKQALLLSVAARQ